MSSMNTKNLINNRLIKNTLMLGVIVSIAACSAHNSKNNAVSDPMVI